MNCNTSFLLLYTYFDPTCILVEMDFFSSCSMCHPAVAFSTYRVYSCTCCFKNKTNFGILEQLIFSYRGVAAVLVKIWSSFTDADTITSRRRQLCSRWGPHQLGQILSKLNFRQSSSHHILSSRTTTSCRHTCTHVPSHWNLRLPSPCLFCYFIG